MKKVLLFLFFIVSVFVANSQTLRPSQLPTTNAAGRFDITGYQMDSAFLYVLRDSFPAKYPSVIYHPNGNLYKTEGGVGAYWTLITDTTWLSNRINLKLSIADTAAMLSNYLHKTDTAGMLDTYVKFSDTANFLEPYHQSFYTAEFDTTSRILTLYPITGTTPTMVTIPRGGTIDGITTLTPNRASGSNVQFLIADNGNISGFSLNTTDSLTRMHFSDTASMLSPYAHFQAVVKYYDTSNMLNPYLRKSDTASMLSPFVQYSDTASMLSPFVQYSDTAYMLSNRLKISDTTTMLSGYQRKGTSVILISTTNGILGGPITTTGTLQVDSSAYSTKANVTALLLNKLNLSDTAAMLSNRLKISDTATMLRNHATYAETLTGKSISGSSNILSNIGNSSLTNSTISGIPLGSNLAALTNGFGITSLSYNGSTAKVVTVDTSSGGVATWALLKKKIDSVSAAGGGSVSSVGLVLPTDVFTVTGSPVTTSGNLTGTFKTQTANKVFASDTSGSAAQPTFRALVAADIPNIYTLYTDTAAMLSPYAKKFSLGYGLSHGTSGDSVQYNLPLSPFSPTLFRYDTTKYKYAYFYGNSITAGTETGGISYPLYVGVYLNLNVVNRGISGTPLEYQFPLSDSAGTKRLSGTPYYNQATDALLSYMYGVNDIFRGSGANFYNQTNYLAAWDTVLNNAINVHGWPPKKILINGITWLTQTGLNSGTPPPTRARVDSFNVAAKLSATKWGVLYVELTDAMSINGDSSVIINPDGIHPSVLGQKIIARQIVKGLTGIDPSDFAVTEAFIMSKQDGASVLNNVGFVLSNNEITKRFQYQLGYGANTEDEYWANPFTNRKLSSRDSLGNLTITGIITAPSFSGSGVSLTGVVKYTDTAIMLRNHATYSEILTGKTISAGSNTITGLTNSNLSGSAGITNANLANSTISGIALGSDLSNLTATDGTLTFSGTYNGSIARTIGLNLSNANTWAADQRFNNYLSIGAAPQSLFSANVKGLTFGNYSTLSSNSSSGWTTIANNAAQTISVSETTGWSYINSDLASRLSLNNGSLKFETAASGTAGAAITWIPALDIANTTGEITASSSITASSFIKSGGTYSQALIADGSVLTVASANTASAIVQRDGSGNFSANNISINHLIGTSGSLSTTGLGTNVSSMTVSGTDLGMTVTVVTSGAVSGTIGTVNFNNAFSANPHVVISCADITTGAATSSLAANATGTGTYIIAGNISGAGTYIYNVIAIQ